MKLKVNYSKSSEKFLKKNKNVLNEERVLELIGLSMKYLIKNEINNVDLKKLNGYSDDRYRIRVGKVRIIFIYKEEKIIIVDIIDIGYRGHVYKS